MIRGIWVVLAFSVTLFAQEVLTNDSILKLAKAGLGEDMILTMIKTQGTRFSTSADDVIALKTNGVSDRIIAAMVTKGSGVPAPTAHPAVASAANPGSQYPDELGVYSLKDNKYGSVTPEVLNLRTARAGAVFTYGIKAAKINGWVVNQHSPNHVGPDAEFLLRIAEGIDPAEYVCLKFDLKDDRREVELARGRINVSVSTHRAAIPFKTEKIGKGVYKLRVMALKGGEYGLLPPGANISSNAASAGKVYTFTVE